MTRVLIVDDQALVRRGLRVIVDSETGLEVCGEASHGREALELAGRTTPDVVVMDVRMPVMDGIEATRRLVARDPEVRVLVLTTFDLDENVFAALRAGASGFVLKDADPDDLLQAIRVVARGEALLGPSITRRLVERFVNTPLAGRDDPRVAALTERELEVLHQVARGRSNTEIGRELHLSGATVKTHVARVLAKLGVRDRVQAVVVAYETGLVRPGDAARHDRAEGADPSF